MPTSTLILALYSVLYAAAIVVGPPLIIATVIGLVIGILQAVTQIQEQTLPQTVKIFVIAFSMVVFGGLLTSPLYVTSSEIFSNFHLYYR